MVCDECEVLGHTCDQHIIDEANSSCLFSTAEVEMIRGLQEMRRKK